MITNQMKSRKNLETIDLILNKACDLWKKSAPDEGDTLYREIVDILRFNKELTIKDTYKYLVRTHKSGFFPVPAIWFEALEYAKQHPTITSLSQDNWLDYVTVGDNKSFRKITRYEKEVIDLVKTFGNCHPLGIEAKAKGYWNEPGANYSFIPSGFTAYVIDIFRTQFVIINKIRAGFCIYAADRNYCNSFEFKKKTLENGKVSAELLRSEDINVFRRESEDLWIKEESLNQYDTNQTFTNQNF